MVIEGMPFNVCDATKIGNAEILQGMTLQIINEIVDDSGSGFLVSFVFGHGAAPEVIDTII